MDGRSQADRARNHGDTLPYPQTHQNQRPPRQTSINPMIKRRHMTEHTIIAHETQKTHAHATGRNGSAAVTPWQDQDSRDDEVQFHDGD